MNITKKLMEKAKAEKMAKKLDNVAGGYGNGRRESPDGYTMCLEEVKFLYHAGDIVKVFCADKGKRTNRCVIARAFIYGSGGKYHPVYTVRKVSAPNGRLWDREQRYIQMQKPFDA